MDTQAAVLCVRCGRRRRGMPGRWREFACPRCGCEVYGSRVMAGTPRDLPVEVVAPLCGVLAGLVTLPPGAVVVLYGAKGIGKSTVALQAFERPYVATTEMDPDLVGAYAARLGVDLAGRVVPLLDAEGALDLQLRDEPDDVVLDSITGTGRPVEALQQLVAWAARTGGRAIAIAQVTVEGTARGGEEPLHIAACVIRIESTDGVRQLVVEKNRFGPEGSRVFTLGESGAMLPPRDRYYSVEGRHPNYRLQSYPAQGTRFADYLTHCEKILAGDEDPRLPFPPLAVAAQRSLLYGGWIEPEDYLLRRAYALAQGVPYFTPITRETFRP